MRLLFLLPLLFIFSNLSSQSLTQTDLMDTTIIQAHSNSQSILVIRTSDFTLYLNKKYLIRLVKRSNEAEKRILIRTLRSSDTVTFDCFGSFSEDVIFKCLNKGKFTCVSNKSDIVYKTILKVDNNLTEERMGKRILSKKTSDFIRGALHQVTENEHGTGKRRGRG